jgi:hypothetical protein
VCIDVPHCTALSEGPGFSSELDPEGGKMSQRNPYLLSVVVLMCVGFLTIGVRADRGERHGHTVEVSVQASDNSPGANLHYAWRSTDGHIENVNAPTTTWALPTGPGLHFAYVLVSNGLGGYTERRVAVNTDNLSRESGDDNVEDQELHDLVAPPGPAQVGDYYRTYVTVGSSAFPGSGGTVQVLVDEPDMQITLQDTTNSSVPPYPLAGPTTTDISGQFVVDFPSVTDRFNIHCTLGLGFGLNNAGCGSDGIFNYVISPPARMAATSYNSFSPTTPPPPPLITGSLALQDGSPCGIQSEFFGVHANATATLLDSAGNTLGGPARVNAFGYYALPLIQGAKEVLLHCENAVVPPITVSAPNFIQGNDLEQSVVVNVSSPLITSMSAKIGEREVGLFLPPPSGFPSDFYPGPDQFLAEKGLDSRLGACQYYKAVGAVKGCNSDGSFYGAASFEDWKHTVKIGKYAAAGATEYRAGYLREQSRPEFNAEPPLHLLRARSDSGSRLQPSGSPWVHPCGIDESVAKRHRHGRGECVREQESGRVCSHGLHGQPRREQR